MIEAMVSGLVNLMSWQVFGMMLLGILIGLSFGIVPGLGGVTALAIFTPFVFGMEPFMGFAFLLSMHAVVTQGGAIPSILLSIPGTSVNVATCLDGYALAKQGRAGEAIGAALTASAFGGVFGAFVLMGLIPLLRPIAMALTPAEIFMLIIFGLTFIIAISRKSLLRGFIAALFGLGLSTVRLDPQTGIGRFTFNQIWLWDGISIIPIVLGMFAFSEMIVFGTKGRSSRISGKLEWGGGYKQLMEGFRAVFRYWWLSIRTSALGVLLGIIPGIGGDAGSWICYGHAAQTCRNNENFGKGDIRGVIAPEVANDAKEGGALLPTVVFGIPGSTGMAVLLGAFLILGLTPGPEMIKEHLDLVWSMTWVLIISNVIASAIMFPLARYFTRLVFVRASLLIPAILTLSVLGALLVRGYWQDLIFAVIFGIIGYGMIRSNFPRAPVILGFILGHLAEENLYKAHDIWGAAFLLRPVAMGLLLLSLLSIAYSLTAAYREKKREKSK